MKAVIYETSEVVENKKEAIKRAKAYLINHPEVKDVGVLRYDTLMTWFIVGRENVDNISNFVKVECD